VNDTIIKSRGSRTLLLERLLYIVLIASLPFWSLRVFAGGVAITHVVLALILLVAILRIVSRLKISSVFDSLDLLLFVYLLSAFASIVYVSGDSQLFVLAKSVVYFLCYLGLKLLLWRFSVDQIIRSTVIGMVIGCGLFVSLVVVSVLQQGVDEVMSGGISYWTLTVNIYGGMASYLGSTKEFSSASIMRSVVGEAFAFYFVFLLINRLRKKYLNVIFLMLNAVLALGTFSRRAMVAMGASMLLVWKKSGKVWGRLLGVFVIASLVGFVVFINEDGVGRLADLSVDVRASQYVEALHEIEKRPISGYGYGTKLKDEGYIHNFILASWYMVGLPGLVISLLVFGGLIKQYMLAVAGQAQSLLAFLLIIPMIGLTIGSTVEGLFTPVGWVILALFSVHRKKTGMDPLLRIDGREVQRTNY